MRSLLCLILLVSGVEAEEGSAQLTSDGVYAEFRTKLNAGQIPDAEALARRLLAQEESSQRLESPELQTALDLLLMVYPRRSDRAGAEMEAVGARAETLRLKLQGPEATATAKTLALRSTAELAYGNHSSAKTLASRAVKIFESREKSAAPFNQADVVEYSQALNAVAGILRVMEDLDAAKRAMLRSISLQESIPPSAARLGNAYLNMGTLEHDTGNHTQALARFRQARATALSLQPVNQSVVQAVMVDEGRCLVETGSLEEGRSQVERALHDREAIYGLDHPGLTRVIDILREIYQFEGRFADARNLAERVSAIRRKAYGPFHLDRAYSEADLARVLAELGDPLGSLNHAIESERIAREHLALNVAKMAEREATLFALKRFSALRFAVSAAVDAKGEAVEPAYDTLIRSRAIIFDELASRHGIQTVPSENAASIASLSEELGQARERLSRLAVSTGARPGDREEEMRQAIEDRDGAERKLAALSVQYRRRIAGRSAGLKEVSAGLPEDAGLISYIRFKHASSGTIEEPQEYAAFVLSRGKSTAVALGPASEIDASVDEVRAKLALESSAPGLATKRNESAYKTAAEKLRKLVWDPIDRNVAGLKRIFIVPDGELHAINFASLPEAGVEGRYLIERGALLHYLSAERDVVTAGSLENSGSGLLAIGNPAFDRPELTRGMPGTGGGKTEVVSKTAAPVFRGIRSSCSTMQSMQFTALPSSGLEIDNISRIWKRSGKGGGDVVELSGELAGPARFKAMAPGRRTIHLAVHAFAAGVDCTDPVRNENPLLLSGLAMAGANRRGAAQSDEDGILTAEEIAALDLRGVEWAVLSACDTGLGKTSQIEGVFGLRRAFQVAGAHTVIMSLWPVEDQVTSEWMRVLYEQRLNQKSDTASAVRFASLETLKHRRSAGLGTHPFYWAPFVDVGDWR